MGENVKQNQLMLAYANCVRAFCVAGQSHLNHDSYLECCIFKFLHVHVILNMCRVIGSPCIVNFRCWTRSEVTILGADQKEHCLWDENE